MVIKGWSWSTTILRQIVVLLMPRPKLDSKESILRGNSCFSLPCGFKAGGKTGPIETARERKQIVLECHLSGR